MSSSTVAPDLQWILSAVEEMLPQPADGDVSVADQNDTMVRQALQTYGVDITDEDVRRALASVLHIALLACEQAPHLDPSKVITSTAIKRDYEVVDPWPYPHRSTSTERPTQ